MWSANALGNLVHIIPSARQFADIVQATPLIKDSLSASWSPKEVTAPTPSSQRTTQGLNAHGTGCIFVHEKGLPISSVR